MRSKRAIENQLKHFRNGCPKAGTEENDTWIKALEWVLADDPTMDGRPSPYANLVTAAITALHALRSYECGNGAPDLAREVADQLDRAILEALENRDQYLDRIAAEVEKVSELLAELQAIAETKTPAH